MPGCSRSNPPSSDSGASSPPTGPTPCPKCNCCVSSAVIQNVRFIGSTPQTVGTGYSMSVSNGHVFDFVFQINFSAGSSGTSDCNFEWWEKTNLPALPGHTPNTWMELRAMFPTNIAFNQWVNRTVPCPGGGSLTITITDPPSLGNAPGITQTRTLEFKLVIKSGTACPCGKMSMTATATQVLMMVNGALVFPGTKFDIGPSSSTP